MQSREVLRRLKDAGWQIVRKKGSHWQLQHPSNPNTVTVPHPKSDIPIGTIKSIEKSSGTRLR
ncbi:MAG: type II toxin-antitoxin system HicA family toxin [Gemmatimonadetes bacterium]|nr:type II toxin-antitoxin system HicA family toxin [Gemmatimonadota bacterium]